MRPIVLGVVAVLLASALAYISLKDARPAADPRPAAQERELRERPVSEIAPARVPSSAPAATPRSASTAAPFPMIGDEGRDEYGYPTQHVDRAALRGLLLHRRFSELTTVVERLQTEFEVDPRKEYWSDDAAEALGTGEADLLPVLDAWAEASPQSFAPFLARGTHWVKRAYERRGGKWAAETSTDDFASMEEALAKALPDLKRAIELRPRLVAAMRQQLHGHLPLSGGHRLNEQVIARAVQACPSCFQVRVMYLHTLKPRPTNPLMRLLPGYLDLDRADRFSGDQSYEKALAAAKRACVLGEHWEFLLGRARVQVGMGHPDAALSDLNRAAALRPGHPDVIFERAFALVKAERWEEAGRELRAGIQVAPTHWMARSIFDGIVKGLVYAGWQRRSAGDHEAALRIYDLAAELAPTNHEVQGRRAFIIAEGTKGIGKGAEEDARAAPDDFRAIQRLDYDLARKGQFERVVGLWNDFLGRHPDNGPAYLERGGALFHLRRLQEARADALKACELGVSEGCVRAKVLGASP